MPFLNFFRVHKEEVLLAVIIILIASLSFGLGRLSVIYEREGEFEIVYPETKEGSVLGAIVSSAGYVPSKTGNKYHFPWCPGARAIKEQNKVYFGTKGEAEAAGYQPAGNCKGI
mgnify:CR=1 FL=1